jgi:hypothetical protein
MGDSLAVYPSQLPRYVIHRLHYQLEMLETEQSNGLQFTSGKVSSHFTRRSLYTSQQVVQVSTS